jgi:hypothetical protein
MPADPPGSVVREAFTTMPGTGTLQMAEGKL